MNKLTVTFRTRIDHGEVQYSNSLAVIIGLVQGYHITTYLSKVVRQRYLYQQRQLNLGKLGLYAGIPLPDIS